MPPNSWDHAGRARRRRAAGPSRRDFLKGAPHGGRAGAGLRRCPQPRRTGAAGIAIVGARHRRPHRGADAAGQGPRRHRLRSLARIGGRMHSDRSGYWAEGQVSEFCGELIDSGHATILGLAARFGLAVDDLLAAEPPGSTDTYWFLGRPLHAPRRPTSTSCRCARRRRRISTPPAIRPLWNKYKPAGHALDHMSIYDWIETRVPGGHASPFGRLLDVAYTIEYGAETTDQSSLNLVYLLAYQPIAQGLRDLRRLGRALSHPRRQPAAAGGDRGRCFADYPAPLAPDARSKRGRTAPWRSALTRPPGAKQVVADQVILTLPFAVLRTLDISRAGFDARSGRPSTSWAPGATPSCSSSSRAATGTAAAPGDFQRLSLHRPRLPEHLGREPRPSRHDRHHRQLHRRRRRRRLRARLALLTRRHRIPRWRAYARAFLRQFETVFPGISAQWNGRATLSTPVPRPRTSAAPTPIGRSASTRPSAATRACRRARSTSPANTARRTSRASWRAAPRKVRARPRGRHALGGKG